MPRNWRSANVIDQLKEAIQGSGRTLTDISKASGVGLDRISRFVRGKRDLTGKAIGQLCEALGLELAAPKPPRRPRGK